MIGRIIKRFSESAADRPFFTLVAGLLISFEIITIVGRAIYHAAWFNGYPANGIFQLLNPLRRLAEGQTFGSDFNVFHGPLTTLVHLPFFLLFGKNLYAASLAEWLIQPLLLLTVIFILVRQCFKDKLALQLFVTWLIYKICSGFLPFLIFPGNSLLGLRAIGPIIVGICLLSLHHLSKKRLLKLNVLWDIIIPFSIGISVFLGTEYGIAVFMAMLITVIIMARGIWLRLFYPLKLLVWTCAWVLILATLISRGHPLLIIKFAFVNVPTDQFWYFGVAPNQFIRGIPQFFYSPHIILCVLIAFSILYYLWFVARNHLETTVKIRTILFLILSSLACLVSALGIFNPSVQTQPSFLYIMLISCLVLPKIWHLYRKSAMKLMSNITHTPQRRLLNLRRPAMIVGLLLIVSANTIVVIYSQTKTYFDYRTSLMTYDSPKVSGSHLSPLWQSIYKTYVDGTQGITSPGNNWSLYPGLFEASNGVFNPSGYDYIIHALGPQARADYVDKFNKLKPESVITLAPGFFPYEPWLQNETWDLYEPLLLNYSPKAQNNAVMVWRRQTAEWITPQKDQYYVPLTGDGQKNTTVTFPATGKKNYRLFAVTVDYDAHYKLAKLPYIGKTPRYIVHRSGLNGIDVSLIPYKTSLTFPVVVTGSMSSMNFSFQTYAFTKGAHLTVKDIRWHEIDLPQDTMMSEFGLYDPKAHHGNWPYPN